MALVDGAIPAKFIFVASNVEEVEDNDLTFSFLDGSGMQQSLAIRLADVPHEIELYAPLYIVFDEHFRFVYATLAPCSYFTLPIAILGCAQDNILFQFVGLDGQAMNGQPDAKSCTYKIDLSSVYLKNATYISETMQSHITEITESANFVIDSNQKQGVWITMFPETHVCGKLIKVVDEIMYLDTGKEETPKLPINLLKYSADDLEELTVPKNRIRCLDEKLCEVTLIKRGSFTEKVLVKSSKTSEMREALDGKL